MKKQETTRQELRLRGVSSINEGSVLLLSTVTMTDNSQDIWLECVDDNGDKVRLVPDLTGWRDGRKEVFAMNTRTGINTKVFFQVYGVPALILPHNATLADETAEKVMQSIPFPCWEWAIVRAR